MSDYLLKELRHSIAERKVLAVVGTGVSVAASGGSLAASWAGLLELGVQRCADLFPSLPPGWAERLLADIHSGDLDGLLSAAERIARRLGAPNGGEYRMFLRDTVGHIEVKDPAVILALARLNVPLATTNYDGLLEQVTGLRSVTWREPARVERVLRGEERGILHLHGYWEDPESVILGIRSYEAIFRDEHAQAMLRAIRSFYTLLFIGYRAGLADPNFGSLLQWTRRVFADSEYRHYRLAQTKDLATFQAEHPAAERIVVLPYGDTHVQLAPFLHNLASEVVPNLSGGQTEDSARPRAREPSENESEPEGKLGISGRIFDARVNDPALSGSSTNSRHKQSYLLSRHARLSLLPVAGRDRELADLHDIAAQHPGTVVAIVGPSGYGKTVLARQLVADLGGGVVEAYVDASLIQSVQQLALHLTELFPMEAWQVRSDLGGRQVDQLNTAELERFIAHMVETARCCLVIDHAESWLPSGRADDSLRAIHITLAGIVRATTHLSCLLTSVSAPPGQLPYRVSIYPLGDTQGAQGISILARHITASKAVLQAITQRVHGHPYALDVLSRRFAGTYGTRSKREALLLAVSELPSEVTHLLEHNISGLTPEQQRLLLALSSYRRPMPIRWVDHSAATSLHDGGFIAHQVGLNASTTGLVVHPLVREAIQQSSQFERLGGGALLETLSNAIAAGHTAASLPLAQQYFSNGFVVEANVITADCWRLWCENSGIDDGLAFIDILRHSSILSHAERAELAFAAGVLHLYKGDTSHLLAAQGLFSRISDEQTMPGIDPHMYRAAVAEQMEVTRRLHGIHATSDLHLRLIDDEVPSGSSSRSGYYQGLVFFLLGHVARYAEDCDVAAEYYEKASQVFRFCSSMNCRLEDRHAIYCIAMCHLKSGRLDAALKMVESVEEVGDPQQMVFVRGLFTYLRAAIELAQGNFSLAEASIQESIVFFKRFQSFSYGARAQVLLGWIRLLSGSQSEANATFSSLLGHSELPKSHIGRAECGFFLSLHSEAGNKGRHLQAGLEKLLSSGDLLGATSILELTVRLEKEVGIAFSGLTIRWGEVDRASRRIDYQVQSVDGLSVGELLRMLRLARRIAPALKLGAVGLA